MPVWCVLKIGYRRNGKTCRQPEVCIYRGVNTHHHHHHHHPHHHHHHHHNNNNVIKRRNSIFSSSFSTTSSPHCQLSPTRALQRKCPWRNRLQITCNALSAYHVHHAVRHVARRDSQALTFDRNENILALFHWLKPLTDEGEEETGVPGENPFKKTPHTTERKFKPQPRLEPALQHW